MPRRGCRCSCCAIGRPIVSGPRLIPACRAWSTRSSSRSARTCSTAPHDPGRATLGRGRGAAPRRRRAPSGPGSPRPARVDEHPPRRRRRLHHVVTSFSARSARAMPVDGVAAVGRPRLARRRSSGRYSSRPAMSNDSVVTRQQNIVRDRSPARCAIVVRKLTSAAVRDLDALRRSRRARRVDDVRELATEDRIKGSAIEGGDLGGGEAHVDDLHAVATKGARRLRVGLTAPR